MNQITLFLEKYFYFIVRNLIPLAFIHEKEIMNYFSLFYIPIIKICLDVFINESINNIHFEV